MAQRMEYIALSPRVLVVAVIDGEVGDWTAYIDAVPGSNHGHEYEEVARHGAKLDIEVATILFSHLAASYKWRP